MLNIKSKKSTIYFFITIFLIIFNIKNISSANANSWKDHRRNLARTKGVVLFKLKENKQLSDYQVSFLNLQESIDLSQSQLIAGSSIYAIHFSDSEKNQNQITNLNLNIKNNLNSIALNNEIKNENSNKLEVNQEETFANKLMQSGLVEFAEPDYIFEPDMVANDPNIKSQWYLNKIEAPNAWDMTTGSNQVQVLICDTGIMSNHPDLKDNVTTDGHNFVDDSNQTQPTGNPHGTIIAGLIGAKGNNGVGIAGLNWNIQIIPGKISNEKNGAAQASTMVKCIQWAIDHKIKIVNLSYSGTESEAVVNASKALFENNGMLFLSMGNKGQEVDTPHNPYAITVGATDHYDFKAYWSNTGVGVDMTAPGTSIFSTDMNGDYTRVQGTSFAAPLVTGTAALLLSMNPKLSLTDIRQILFDSAIDLGTPGYDIAYGHGRLNINKALSLYKEKYSVK